MIIRTAFVLGAGLGTRLKSLTARRPKPLIPVANRPLISYAFDHLLGAGVERLVVNTHWRAEAYQTAFPDSSYRGTPIAFRHESPEVLETAGGIKNVEDLVGDAPFIVYNGDILTDLPLASALAHHAASGNEVTMILRSKDGPLQVAFDESSGRIADIGSRLDSGRESRFLFTGVYLVSPEFLRRIPPATKISVVPIFCEMIRTGAALGGIVIDDGHWHDLGTREHYLAVHRRLLDGSSIADSAQISASAKIEGASAIGAHARVGGGAELHDCLVWENAEVAPGAQLTHCIVTDGAHAAGIHRDVDF
jgi:NDP-sugar pyrophosphorylase family protein